MKISIIVAASLNNVIGKDNKLPWRLKDDMKHFVEVTKGKAVLMGRKTFESLPGVLPNRRNYILTRNFDSIELLYDIDAFVFMSIDLAIEWAKKEGEEELLVIGGEQIYRQMLPLADRVYMTFVQCTVEGDAYWPQELFDIRKSWNLTDLTWFPKSDRNEHSFSIQTWDRVKQQKK